VQTLLSERDRAKLDEQDDKRFYRSPRFVTHADDGFTARLTGLYEAVLSPVFERF